MITSERDELVGGHVTSNVKLALQREAAKQGVSVSLFIARLVVETLVKRGHRISEKDQELCGYSR
jgi:hypothetical protein